ncbi:SMC family ATPase, partial [Methanothermococcus sp. SCGC AD-155-N22]|nr:SMC family ATPase [Methanothermococcus sp. SCGC AD-155-N22]
KYVDYYEDLERKKTSLEREIGRYREDYEKYKNALAVLENYSKRYNVDVSKLIETLEKKIKEIEEELSTLRDKREEYIREIESLRYDKEHHYRIKEEVEKIYNNLVSIEKKIGECNARLEALRENLQNLLKELEDLKEKEKEKEKLERYIKYLEDIRENVFSKDGFQQYLRKRYIPLIQRYTNEIFSEFELPYHHIQIKDDYDILVDDFSVKSLSGGEQIAVSLALRLGIAKALCGNLQFIVLDEPTAFLDEDRRKKLLNIFKSIKTISQIFIISHHQELEQIADNIIYVTKIGGISKVKLPDNSGEY